MIKLNLTSKPNGCCELCGWVFNEGESIFCSTLDGQEYCDVCVREEEARAAEHECAESFCTYLMHGGIGQLLLDSESFPELDEGVYELKELQGLTAVTDKINGEPDISAFYSRAGSDEVLMEKCGSDMLLLYPKKLSVDKFDYYAAPDIWRKQTNEFCAFCGEAEPNLIVNAGGFLVGLTTVVNGPHGNFRNAQRLYKLMYPGYMIMNMNMLAAQARSLPADRRVKIALTRFAPEEMLSYFQNRIQGQGYELQKAVYQFYRYLEKVAAGEPFTADSWFLTAPSGSGKTELFRTVGDFFKTHEIPIPVVQIDLSQITEAGFKGDNTAMIPKAILAQNSTLGGIGICFLDEADKKCVPSYSHDVNVNRAVQSNLLTLVEGSRSRVELENETVDFDSGKTMFVFMGAFQELRNGKRKDKAKMLGFSPDSSGDLDSAADSFHEELTMQELTEFGLIEELAGRMVQIVNFHRLSRTDMLALIKCKVREISALLELNIEITEEAAEEFLEISFGNLGVRRPMNLIKELAQTAVSQVFFCGGFDRGYDSVIIESPNSARIKHGRDSERNAELTS